MFVRHDKFITATGKEAEVARILRQVIDESPSQSMICTRRTMRDGKTEFITVTVWPTYEDWYTFVSGSEAIRALQEDGHTEVFEGESYEVVAFKVANPETAIVEHLARLEDPIPQSIHDEVAQLPRPQ